MPDLIKPFRLSCIQNMQTIAGKTYLYPTVFFGFSLLDPEAILTEAQYLESATDSLPAGDSSTSAFRRERPRCWSREKHALRREPASRCEK